MKQIKRSEMQAILERELWPAAAQLADKRRLYCVMAALDAVVEWAPGPPELPPLGTIELGAGFAVVSAPASRPTRSLTSDQADEVIRRAEAWPTLREKITGALSDDEAPCYYAVLCELRDILDGKVAP